MSVSLVNLCVLFSCALQMRMELEKLLNRPLKEYRSFIDQEMLLIIRQLDSASQIFDFVYLGSEWNACNLQELQSQGYVYQLPPVIQGYD